MFLRRITRRKKGKTHLYWSVVENKRLDDGRVVQRHVLYLGEINSSQAEAWRKAVEVFDPRAGASRTLALFPEVSIGVEKGPPIGMEKGPLLIIGSGSSPESIGGTRA